MKLESKYKGHAWEETASLKMLCSASKQKSYDGKLKYELVEIGGGLKDWRKKK
jgi:hypothetical protein